MIELTFLKELKLIKKVHQKSVIHYQYFLDEEFKFQPNVCNSYHVLSLNCIKPVLNV